MKMPRKHAAGTLNKDIDKKEMTKTFSTKLLCWIKLGLLEKAVQERNVWRSDGEHPPPPGDRE